MSVRTQNPNKTLACRLGQSGHATALSNAIRTWRYHCQFGMNLAAEAPSVLSNGAPTAKNTIIMSTLRSTTSIAQPSNPHRPCKPNRRA